MGRRHLGQKAIAKKIGVVASSVIVLSLGFGAWLAPGGGAGRSGGSGSSIPIAAHPSTSANVAYTTTRIYYSSSVDGFNLSYQETRPSPFNSSRTYPLAIELHGLTGETLPIWGGIPNYIVPTTAQAAVNAGIILLNPCTRTGSGWYIDSNYTGPQEQDVLDALTHEQTIRHIGAVYLFGESMGSIGTLEIGLDHPHLFNGLGAIASFSDYFEMFAYWNQTLTWGLPLMLLPTGGQYPNASAYARGIFLHLSSLRFHPTNLSGLPLFVANGAQDSLATNNLSVWPYQQENNTLVNRTCLVSTVFAEPADCTMPIVTLAALHPGKYNVRYLFEPNGPHDYYLLNATDMFAYFLGHAPSGVFWGKWPVPTAHSPPQPLLSFATRPLACGSISLGTHVYRTGDTVPITAGNYSVSFTPCGSKTVASVRASGGAHYSASTGIITLAASGAIVVTFV